MSRRGRPPEAPYADQIGRDLKIRGYTVGQFPNPPLWAALAALLVATLTNAGTVHDLARAVFCIAFTVWAYEEAAHGVNGFRRVLGVVALGLIAVTITRTIQ